MLVVSDSGKEKGNGCQAGDHPQSLGQEQGRAELIGRGPLGAMAQKQGWKRAGEDR